MNKPDLLRQHLLEALPDLPPERLTLSIGQGRTAIVQSATLSFEYRYSLTVTINDFSGGLDTIMVPVLAWLERNQPERLRQPAHEALTFEIATFDTGQTNFTIVLDLSETVLAEPREGGGYTLTYVPEPDYDPGFDNVPDTARLQTLALGDETVF
ncbi:phage tail protein [Pedomonas mirosovicensis]|uniref:phage tail protein n=1 Tax=Pedomonas mirosovicensis TaxID=2908641 RepID=UPI002168EA11|nr:phage tail protein [Pedomonas mirosovicensis]MCH8686464.1 phage tail protein [Pedomonas mirosovicensis]